MSIIRLMIIARIDRTSTRVPANNVVFNVICSFWNIRFERSIEIDLFRVLRSIMNFILMPPTDYSSKRVAFASPPRQRAPTSSVYGRAKSFTAVLKSFAEFGGRTSRAR